MMDMPLHLRIAQREGSYDRKEKLFDCLGNAFLSAYLRAGSGEQLRNRALAKLVELPDAQETIAAQEQLSTTLRQEVARGLDNMDDGYRADVRKRLQELCRGEPTPHSLDGAIYKICAKNLFSAEVSSWEVASIREIGEQVYNAIIGQRPASSLAEIQTLMQGIGAYTKIYTPSAR